MNMKKLVQTALLLTFVWGIAGCGNGPEDLEDVSGDNGQSLDAIEDIATDSISDANDTVRPPDVEDDGWLDALPDTPLDALPDTPPDTRPDADEDVADALPDPGETNPDSIDDVPDSLHDQDEPSDVEIEDGSDTVQDADIGICTPSCDEMECGDDGCGGSCGECLVGICLAGRCLTDMTCAQLHSCITDCVDETCADGCLALGNERSLGQFQRLRDCAAALCNPLDIECINTVALSDCIEPYYACVTDKCDPVCDGRNCGTDGCGGTCGTCDDHFVCLHGHCSYVPYCGDGTCDLTAVYNEDCGSCLLDCPCGCGETCQGAVCEFTACDGRECGDDGCGGYCGSQFCEEHYGCSDGICVWVPECGNEVCESDSGEGCATCLDDCPCGCGENCQDNACIFAACDDRECGDDGCGGSCGECDDHFVCELGKCLYVPYCGDGTCDKTTFYTETCGDCPDDCGCHCGETCASGICTFTACVGRECGADGCDGSCGDCGPWEECGVDGVCALTIGMVWATVEAGSFWMGCASGDAECNGNEIPRHNVTLNRFRIMNAEVTENQYLQVMGSLPGGITTPPTQEGLPVVGVSWAQAWSFCQQIGARLPTEAEWEYAARAGIDEVYSCGANASCLDATAWHNGNSSIEGTLTRHAIRQMEPNDWGLYDMDGNVQEWVNDWFDSSYYERSPVTDPTGPETGSLKCIRGGKYDELSTQMRSSVRWYADPTYTDVTRGFRCVRLQ